jgi:hypothetical protein
MKREDDAFSVSRCSNPLINAVAQSMLSLYSTAMKIQLTHRQRAFTMMEGLMVGAALALLLAIFLPVLANSRRHVYRGNCGNNLQQVGIAFRI